MMTTDAHLTESRRERLSPPGLQRRLESWPAPHPADDVRIERGTFDDFRRLASFHYRGGRPGAPTAVFRLVHDAPTVVGRFTQHRGTRHVIGVLVRSLPHLACQLRDLATAGRFSGLDVKARARLLNREMRTISRVVIHPQWRSLGLAVRIVRHALHHPETPYTEALAAMGRIHPFFERAGMVRYDRPRRAEHSRLIDALNHLDLQPTHLASRRMIDRQLRRREPRERRWLHTELVRWYRSAFRAPKRTADNMTFDELIPAARDHLLLEPVYYLSHHDGTTRREDVRPTREN